MSKTINGFMLKLKKEGLNNFGDYSKGFMYVADATVHVLLLKPSTEKEHVYNIPQFHEVKTRYIAEAIYTLLHSKHTNGKERSKVTIKDQKAGVYDFYSNETLIEIHRKLVIIDEAQLH